MNWEFIIKYLPHLRTGGLADAADWRGGDRGSHRAGAGLCHGAVLPGAGAAADRGVLY